MYVFRGGYFFLQSILSVSEKDFSCCHLYLFQAKTSMLRKLVGKLNLSLKSLFWENPEMYYRVG